MIERLLEDWLDNVGERGYQHAFCQILTAKGHRILHSTRHGPIELGKDIISIAPDGILCAFQLKGNPGGRLSLTQYRNEVEQQLFQLATHALSFPGVDGARHRSFLVTNGWIEEETQLAIRELNTSLVRKRVLTKDTKISWIARGELLTDLHQYAGKIWPIRIQEAKTLLELLATDGAELFPIEKFHKVMSRLLHLSEGDKATRTKTQLSEAIFAAALLTAVILSSFREKDNHFAVISAWTLLGAYCIAAAEKFRFTGIKALTAVLNQTEAFTFSALASLAKEMQDRNQKLEKHKNSANHRQLWRASFTEGNSLYDTPFLDGRITLVTALLAIFWLWCAENKQEEEELPKSLLSFLSGKQAELRMWGEGAVPQMLAVFWFIERANPNLSSESLLISCLRTVIETQTGDTDSLPDPYRPFEEVLGAQLKHIVGDPSAEDFFRNDWAQSSYMVESLMHIAVRRNLKRTCQTVWADYSRILIQEFSPRDQWSFCLWRSDNGRNHSRATSLTKEWNDLKKEARSISLEGVPEELRSRKFLLLLYSVILPYRATASVLRYLDKEFGTVWMIEPPLGKAIKTDTAKARRHPPL